MLPRPIYITFSNFAQFSLCAIFFNDFLQAVAKGPSDFYDVVRWRHHPLLLDAGHQGLNSPVRFWVDSPHAVVRRVDHGTARRLSILSSELPLSWHQKSSSSLFWVLLPVWQSASSCCGMALTDGRHIWQTHGWTIHRLLVLCIFLSRTGLSGRYLVLLQFTSCFFLPHSMFCLKLLWNYM